MKIHEYDQMMKYLTRPADPRTKEQKPMKILKYLDVMGKNYGDKNIRVKSDQEYEKIEADAKAEYLKKNPTYPTEASSAEMEALKGRLDNARAYVTPPKKKWRYESRFDELAKADKITDQQTLYQKSKKKLNNWELIKATATSPEEIADIRKTVNDDFKRNGGKNMDPADKKYLDKPVQSTADHLASNISKEITAMQKHFGFKDEDLF